MPEASAIGKARLQLRVRIGWEYSMGMKARTAPPEHKVTETGEAPERGYAAWKRAKIERALTQAEDRDSLIPAEKIWRDLGLER